MEIEATSEHPNDHCSDYFYAQSADHHYPRARSASALSIPPAFLTTINLNNDAKWIALDNNGAEGSFLSVELKASLETPSVLDISDMDCAGNEFEIYDHNSLAPLGSTSAGKAAFSSNGEGEDEIKIRWSNGRIILPPGQHQLRIKVVRTVNGGKIGIRLAPAEVIGAPLKYKNGKVKLEKSTTITEVIPGLKPFMRAVKLFLIKSKLPANSIDKGCRLYGGIPAKLGGLELSDAVQYVLTQGGLGVDSSVFIGGLTSMDASSRKKGREDDDDEAVFTLTIKRNQGIVTKSNGSKDNEVLPIEYVLCRTDQDAINAMLYPGAEAKPNLNLFKKSSSRKLQSRSKMPSLSRSFFSAQSSSSSDSSSSDSEKSSKFTRTKFNRK